MAFTSLRKADSKQPVRWSDSVLGSGLAPLVPGRAVALKEECSTQGQMTVIAVVIEVKGTQVPGQRGACVPGSIIAGASS